MGLMKSLGLPTSNSRFVPTGGGVFSTAFSLTIIVVDCKALQDNLENNLVLFYHSSMWVLASKTHYSALLRNR